MVACGKRPHPGGPMWTGSQALLPNAMTRTTTRSRMLKLSMVCGVSNSFGSCLPHFVVRTFGNNCKTQGTRAWCHGDTKPGAADEQAPSSQHRFLLDMLPQGCEFKPLVSEYGFYDKGAAVTNMNFSEQQFLHNLPKGTKSVHRQLYKGIFRVDASENNDIKCHISCMTEHSTFSGRCK